MPSATTLVLSVRASARMLSTIAGRSGSSRLFTNERSIFERVDRQLVQVAQRRVAGAEVVEIDFHAEVAQLAQQLRGDGRAVHQRRLGDFEAQVARLQPGAVHRLLDDATWKFCCVSCRLDTLTVM